MVWALILSLLLLLSSPSIAFAEPEGTRATYTVYASTAPNSSYLDWAAMYLPKMGFGDDYVFFRSGQYQYCLAVGNLSWSGGSFSGGDIQCTFLNLSYAGSSDLSLTHSSGSFSLSPGDKVVYSSLGDFPTLAPDLVYLELIIFLGLVAIVMSILRYIWSFLLRMGVYAYGHS